MFTFYHFIRHYHDYLYEDEERVERKAELEALLYNAKARIHILESRPASEFFVSTELEVTYDQLEDLKSEIEECEKCIERHRFVESCFGFLYLSYDEWVPHWELVELLKKFVLCSVIIFVREGTTAQVAFAFLVTLCFFVAHILVLPFLKDEHDTYNTISLVSTLITLFCALVLKAQRLNPTQSSQPYLTLTHTDRHANPNCKGPEIGRTARALRNVGNQGP